MTHAYRIIIAGLLRYYRSTRWQYVWNTHAVVSLTSFSISYRGGLREWDLGSVGEGGKGYHASSVGNEWVSGGEGEGGGGNAAAAKAREPEQHRLLLDVAGQSYTSGVASLTASEAPDTCPDSPFDPDCASYTYPEARAEMELDMLCNAMSDMPGCSVRSACKVGLAR